VSVALNAPLDVFMVRKLGAPGHEELAMGAITSGGEIVLSSEVIEARNITDEQIQSEVQREQGELARREQQYRDGRPAPELRDRTVIVVDDGLATGSTMRAAALAIRKQAPRQLVVAVPVSDRTVCASITDIVDEIVCLITPDILYAVGLWYEDFTPTSDEEVRDLLHRRQGAIEVSGALP